MKKFIIPSAITIAVLAGIYFVLTNNKAKNEAQTAIVAQKNSAVLVRTAQAAYQEVNTQYVSNGVFSPKQEVKISAETNGKVVKVLVEEGATVGAGQTLAIIEGDKQNVSVSNAQSVYNNAKAEVARYENAYATGGVTKQQLDQMKLQLENAKNNLQSARIEATDVYIKASFSGIVNKRLIEPGSYVNPGKELFEIVNVSTLKLTVNVDEKNIGNVKIGQQVLVESSVHPNESWTGVVSFIAPKADANLNFPVEMEIKNNANNDLKAGMYGVAKFGGNETNNVFVVPRTAFVGNISSNKIFAAQDGKAVLKDVVAGRNFGDYVEVISGINNGEMVITTGQINLLNETPIKVIN